LSGSSRAWPDRKFLAPSEAIDATGFSQQDGLSRELFLRQFAHGGGRTRFKSWEIPVNQMEGPHLYLPELITLTPFANTRDYEN